MIYEHILLDEWNPAVYLTAYIPDLMPIFDASLDNHASSVNRKAMLLCPGGGYLGFNEPETEAAALQFLAAGYCTFVLRYSIGAGQAALPTPIVELSKAIGKIRSHAAQWQIDKDQIYSCGFSTGAHLALLQAEVCDADWLFEMTRLPADIIRPNGLILGYPLVDLTDFENHLSNNLPAQRPLIEMINLALYNNPAPDQALLSKWHWRPLMHDHTPPMFLWAFAEDRLLPEAALEQLKTHAASLGVTCETHIFEGGANPHGSGLFFAGNLIEGAKFQTAVSNFLGHL